MSVRSSWQIQQAVIKALLARELKTRFGKNKLGYAWVIGQPLLQILVLVTIFSIISRSGFQGIEFAFFFTAGIIPFGLFSQLTISGAGAVQSNQGLFSYRQVKPFDAFLTRYLLETALSLVTLICIISLFLWAGLETSIHDPLLMLISFLLLSIFSLGCALIAGALSTYVKDAGSFLTLLLRPLYFLSGVFFPLSIIPMPYREWLLWNPVLHAIEIIRIAWFGHYLAPGTSLSYLALCSLIALTIGMLAYRSNWMRMVAT